MAEIEFFFNNQITTIQCNLDDKIKDICKIYSEKIKKDINLLYFIYDSNILNENYLELSFNEVVKNSDKERKKINLSVKEKMVKSKEIICPKCTEDIRIKINEYKVTLFDCIFGHTINTNLSEFQNSQYIDESEIKCNNCSKYNKFNTNNNEFYKCNVCKINLCPLCKSNHDESHKIINYELKNYICEEHNEDYISYCKECKYNLCPLCLKEHSNHNIMKFKDLMIDKEQKIKEKNELRKKIDSLNNDIKEIISKLNSVLENLEIYYKICEEILNNYNFKNKNYQSIQNINEIFSQDVVNDINSVIKENITTNKFYKIMKIYYKMNQEEPKEKDENELKYENKNEIINNIKQKDIEEKEKESIKEENIINEQNNEKINEIKIIYKIDKNEKEIKLFGSTFIKNNRGKCKFMHKDKEYELIEYFNTKKIKDEFLEIKLKDINNITDMSFLFSKCSSLSSLPDISKWDTKNITNLANLFSYCSKLSVLPDISTWNTKNVTNMSSMFLNCSKLSSLPDISKWTTDNVSDISYIFYNCSKLCSLPDISKWNTKNVKNMKSIFYYCSSLSSLPDISKWDTGNVTNMSYMFYNCSKISRIPDISKWNTNNVTDISDMFYNCMKLASLPDINKWNIDKVKDKSEMFYNCPKLSQYIPSKFK